MKQGERWVSFPIAEARGFPVNRLEEQHRAARSPVLRVAYRHPKLGSSEHRIEGPHGRFLTSRQQELPWECLGGDGFTGPDIGSPVNLRNRAFRSSPALKGGGSTPCELPPMSSMETISATVPDWSRESCRRWAWDPGRQLLRTIRGYQAWQGCSGPLARLAKARWVFAWRFWSAIGGADIPLNCRLGGGLLLPHPNGIVIHPSAEIGVNCLIFQQVTIGTGGPLPGAPRIDGHVDIGAGAKILGGVHLGEHSRIGANAVVLRDVPAGSTAVGVPVRRPSMGNLGLDLLTGAGA